MRKRDLETTPVLRSNSAKDESAEILRPGDKTEKRPKKKKKLVPRCAVWWSRAGHPMLKFFGAEVRSQCDEKRGWTLDDLHDATSPPSPKQFPSRRTGR